MRIPAAFYPPSVTFLTLLSAAFAHGAPAATAPPIPPDLLSLVNGVVSVSPAPGKGSLPAKPAAVATAAEPLKPAVSPEQPPERGSSLSRPAASPAPQTHLTPRDLVRQELLDQLDAQTQLARRAAESGDTALAEQAYERLLCLPVPAADKRNALVQMAAYYKGRLLFAKAAAIYEKVLALFPDDSANPQIFLDLGRVYRGASLYDLAISRFYSVLNSTISQQGGQEETRARRNLSLLARFEIAEASFAKGDFSAASKFYSRLQLLELPAADRPNVAFKNALSLFQLEDYAAATAALRAFIDEFPSSLHTLEARSLLARSYVKLLRPNEATDAVLALLRQEKKTGAPGDLARWQKETGRQVATQFYEAGDFRSALIIYQTLATLDPSADWQWPIVYEIGLCFERLNLPDRAREAYAYLLPRPAVDGKETDEPDARLAPALAAIRGMARWRQDHLAWQQTSASQVQTLLGSLEKRADDLPPGAAVSSH